MHPDTRLATDEHRADAVDRAVHQSDARTRMRSVAGLLLAVGILSCLAIWGAVAWSLAGLYEGAL